MADFESSWSAADPAVLRCLEQAHASLLAGGLPCGAVVVDEDGGRPEVQEVDILPAVGGGDSKS
jgi:hypothetical protein